MGPKMRAPRVSGCVDSAGLGSPSRTLFKPQINLNKSKSKQLENKLLLAGTTV